jgi:hypothetical protein
MRPTSGLEAIVEQILSGKSRHSVDCGQLHPKSSLRCWVCGNGWRKQCSSWIPVRMFRSVLCSTQKRLYLCPHPKLPCCHGEPARLLLNDCTVLNNFQSKEIDVGAGASLSCVQNYSVCDYGLAAIQKHDSERRHSQYSKMGGGRGREGRAGSKGIV